jgi:chromosome segregation ATPase
MSTSSAADVYNAELATQSALIEEATRRVRVFESMLAEINTRANPLAAAKQAAEEEYLSKTQSIEKKYADREDPVSKTMIEINAKQEELEQVSQSIKDLTKQVDDLNKSKEQVTKSIKSNNQQEIRSLSKSLDAVDKDISKQTAEIEKLKTALAAAEQKLVQSKDTRSSTVEQIADLESKLPELIASDVQPIENKIDTLSMEVSKLSEQQGLINIEIESLGFDIGHDLSPIKVEKVRCKNLATEKKKAAQDMKQRKAVIDESSTLQHASAVFNNIKKMFSSAVKDGHAAEKRANRAIAEAKTTLDKAVKTAAAEEKKREKAEAKSKSKKSSKSKKDTDVEHSPADAETEEDEADQAARKAADQAVEAQPVKAVDLDPLEAADRAAREAADRAALMEE